ncbi:MAG: ABC transporter ATP-binding protein [Deltaproteobacteria bacterium]|nr:ABC transporter ATP-binding protein [Deltaproteobacteria bacterium]
MTAPAPPATDGALRPLVEARGVTRVYRQGEIDVHALRGVDLDVSDGEFTALVGPSGSGKSTLLNVIGALDAPTSGAVTVGGHRLTGLSRTAAAHFRLDHVGFVFQAYNLLPVFTAYENAEYTLVLQGVPRAERRERVLPLLERVGLTDMMDRRPHELSGGQQQRVAVVRAIASNPQLVLADEPTANLDSETSRNLLDLMLELNREAGTTFVFASHDEHLMERVRRVVHLKDGRIDHDERRDGM